MSRDAAMRELRKQLRATPPAGLAALSEEQLRDLAAAIEEARRRQAKVLQEAGERALERIPRLLRGAVRKVAGG